MACQLVAIFCRATWLVRWIQFIVKVSFVLQSQQYSAVAVYVWLIISMIIYYSVRFWQMIFLLYQPCKHTFWDGWSIHTQQNNTPFNGFFSRTTWASWYQKGKTSLNLNEARNDEALGWQWHQLGHMQTNCTLLQTDNHTNTSSLNFYRARCSSSRPTNNNNIKELKATSTEGNPSTCPWLAPNDTAWWEARVWTTCPYLTFEVSSPLEDYWALRQRLYEVLTWTTLLHMFNGPFFGTTQVSWHQKGKTNLDFTEARDSEWQWYQLCHMQVCTSLQTDNHASTPPLRFLQARCPSCCCPVWALERCRISPPRFLAECCKRQLNQGSFVLLYFRLLWH